MRSFPRLCRFVYRGCCLAFGFLICLSCAKPFAHENLQEGMTAETVRADFGAPRTEEATSDRVYWTYLHEEVDPFPLQVGPIPLRVAVASIWGIPLFLVPRAVRPVHR